MAELQDVTGPVAYEKSHYIVDEKRQFSVHYIGDDHNKKTSCLSSDALDMLSLLTNTFDHPHPELDVFVEVGLGYIGKERDAYLSKLVHYFKAYHCLSNRPEDRERCGLRFPEVRFHCVDFRHTLYLEYQQVIDYWYSHARRMDKEELLKELIRYGNQLAMTKKVPYDSSFRYARELRKIAWIYDMVQARIMRYNQLSYEYPFAHTLSEFIVDLYTLICIGELEWKNPIKMLYPEHLKNKQAYYTSRLANEYSEIPEVIKYEDIRYRFDYALETRIKKIASSSTFSDIMKDTSYSRTKLLQQASVQLSWLMDMYTCFRLVKPYVTQSIVILGVDHINQINEFMTELGIQSIRSKRFYNLLDMDKYDHGVQCVSIPVDEDGLDLSDDLFEDLEPKESIYKKL